jgi:hypothetical protein
MKRLEDQRQMNEASRTLAVSVGWIGPSEVFTLWKWHLKFGRTMREILVSPFRPGPDAL